MPLDAKQQLMTHRLVALPGFTLWLKVWHGVGRWELIGATLKVQPWISNVAQGDPRLAGIVIRQHVVVPHRQHHLQEPTKPTNQPTTSFVNAWWQTRGHESRAELAAVCCTWGAYFKSCGSMRPLKVTISYHVGFWVIF